MLLKTLLLDYCTKTCTDFHPDFLFLSLFFSLHYYSVAFCQLCFYNKDWIGLVGLDKQTNTQTDNSENNINVAARVLMRIESSQLTVMSTINCNGVTL